MKKIIKNSNWLTGPAALAVLSAPLLTPDNIQAQEAAAKPEDKPKWKQSAGLGFTLTEGNSDTILFTLGYDGSKKWDDNEIAVGLNAGYGENDNVKNNEYVKAFGQYNWLFGQDQRWFTFGRLEGRYDAIADIDYRAIGSAGMGYYFLKQGVDGNEKFNLSAEIGPGYVVEKIGGNQNDYATFYAGEKFTWEISDKSRLWQSLDFSPQLDDFANYVVNGEIGIETDITESLSLRSVLTDTYRSEPAAGRKNNDLKFVTSVAYKF